MLGLFTRWSAFMCRGLVGVAYWKVYGFNSFLPVVNGGELPAVYCFVFLFIAAKGGGIWSLDHRRNGASVL